MQECSSRIQTNSAVSSVIYSFKKMDKEDNGAFWKEPSRVDSLILLF